jgi:hypothetical protein
MKSEEKKKEELMSLENALASIQKYDRLLDYSIVIVNGKFKIHPTGMSPLSYTAMNEFLRGYLFSVRDNF